MSKLVELFCDVDYFCKVFILQWRKQLLEDATRKRQKEGQREGQMTTYEIMTIVVSFHMSHYRDFKNYSLGYVSLVYKNAFPNLLNYTRFYRSCLELPCPCVPTSHHLKESHQDMNSLTLQASRCVITSNT
ncbi:transposase [Paraglaciecola psychrophila 170]|uniref:Transposase n=1 Tax=Paraglaciecola psychrophila 170 TaxID=1129794 RepID=M4RUW9_9ALTE|nr:transposase [Paraglaciecola psychrophila 170]